MLLFSVQYVSIYSMKRISQKIVPNKQINYDKRKYPSAIFQPKDLFAKNSSYLHGNFKISDHVISLLIQEIMRKAENIIEIEEENKFYKSLVNSTIMIASSLEQNFDPNYQQDWSQNCPESQPIRNYCDPICGFDRLIEMKRSHKENSLTGIQIPNSKEDRLKDGRSTAQFKRNSRSNLTPLGQAESEKDIRFQQIQSYYREKFNREQINQNEQKIPKILQSINKFKAVKSRQKESFGFDYNGQRINISNLTTTKKNNINILKTIYKIQKDKQETKLVKKTIEKIESSKLPFLPVSSRNLDSVMDQHLMKQRIQKEFRNNGNKLSLRVVSEGVEEK